MRLATPSTPHTEAAETKQTLRELDRRTASSTANIGAVGQSARHAWHGSISLPPNAANQSLTGAVTDVDDGLATYTNGTLLLNRAGRWALWLQMTSDCTVNGNSACWIDSNPALAPWGPFFGAIRDDRIRGSGYSFAGYLVQSVSWSGLVTPEQAANPLFPGAVWRSATGANNASADWALTAHYLGGTLDAAGG